MTQYKLTGNHIYKGQELALEGLIEMNLTGFFRGEIYGHKGLKHSETEKNISVPIEGTIGNYIESMFENNKNPDMTVLSISVYQPAKNGVWFSPARYKLTKPKSKDDNGIIIQDKLIKSIPGMEFISGEYVGEWHQDIMVYDGPTKRAKGKPNTASGGNGIAKIVLTKLE